ncbi:Cytoplasmic tRNA 2-thiolation protein 2 [Apodemus speciosus]|uniref:Cytoplasmic tRNA 2-thiolation protein 2 n=1 Tax=Apodemus speciosus TaxID=105296 RepID=A0ABQ0F3A7_APOSI
MCEVHRRPAGGGDSSGRCLLQGLFQGILCPQIQSHAWEEPSHLSWREGCSCRGPVGLRPAPWSGKFVRPAHMEGLSQDSAKRLRFVPGVIYVDGRPGGTLCVALTPQPIASGSPSVKPTCVPPGFYRGSSLWPELRGQSSDCGQGEADPGEHWFPMACGCPRRGAQLAAVSAACVPEASRTEEAYKAAVGSFLQQQHVLGTQGQDQLHLSHSQEPLGTAGYPRAAQTEALSKLFNSIKTLTAKEELLQTLRTHLTVHVARTHGYCKVMTGESCTRLAIKLMTNLALGRGAFLAWDTGFSDERHGDVVLVRPMRDHTLKEVAFYNHLFGVPSVFTPAIDTKAPEKASIHRLMEAFILKLQLQFPSTVSTVYRTSEKLVKAPREGCTAGSSGPSCLLCMCALDIDTADSATAFGAQSSSHLSQMLTAEAAMPTQPCRGAGEGQAQSCHRAVGTREDARACVTEQLCYSCRVNMKDLPSLDPLPPYVLAEAQLRGQRGSVSEEIQECLITDEEEEDDS